MRRILVLAGVLGFIVLTYAFIRIFIMNPSSPQAPNTPGTPTSTMETATPTFSPNGVKVETTEPLPVIEERDQVAEMKALLEKKRQEDLEEKGKKEAEKKKKVEDKIDKEPQPEEGVDFDNPQITLPENIKTHEDAMEYLIDQSS